MNQSAVPNLSPESPRGDERRVPDGPGTGVEGTLEVVPLGGLGEFGMNMMALSWDDTTVLVDAGVMFPDPDQLGADLIIPDLSYLESRRQQLKALILTHGHEDHIGAVPHVMPLFDGPVYGTPFTLALVRPKLEEHGIDPGARLKPVAPRQTVAIGPLSVEFIRVTHSMPDCVALAITTPLGVVIHSGDFKIDQTPLDGEHFDLHRFAELGARGVLALFADSTNIDRRGFTGPEIEVIEAFEELFTSTEGKLVVATFATSIYRMQLLVDLAAQFDRRVAFVGRSLVQNAEIAQRLGYLRVPSGLQIREIDVQNYASQDVLCITTGSQGEPQAALPRIAIDDHRHVRLGPGDTVVFSARAIPGNEKAIARTMSHVARRGADVVTPEIKHVHVSGHGSAEELKLLLSLVRPKYFVPIHGEYRQLAQHARIATRVMSGADRRLEVLLAQDGDIIQFDRHGARIADRAPAGRVLIDVTRVGEIGDEVLRDRRHLAADGLIVAVVAVSKQTGVLVGEPELVARGFVVPEAEGDALFADAAGVIAECIATSNVEERTDQGLMTEKLRIELRRFFKKRSGRRPLVLPVLMEI
ncbi:MAG TPA: ribonuclease J [Vicinamibacterales bacterium]|nr:ribonuclease J [Vicinamibacterales bacterium]